MIMNVLRTVLLALALSVSSSHVLADQQAKPPHLDITWLGGATLALQFNGVAILTDPVLGEGPRAFTMGDPNEMFDLKQGPNVRTFERLTPLPEVDPRAFDLVILSHAHEDHFDQRAQKALSAGVDMIVPPADLAKVQAMGFTRARGMAWGHSRTIDAGAGRITITAVNAHHSKNADLEPVLGIGNGYWLEFSQGGWRRTVYWTGDTFATEDVVATVRELGRPDVMIPHVGRVGTTGPLGQITMGADDLVAFANRVSAKTVLPIHHSTYRLYLEPISTLAERAGGQAFSLDLISAGTTVKY